MNKKLSIFNKNSNYLLFLEIHLMNNYKLKSDKMGYFK